MFHVSWVVAVVFCTPFVCMLYTSSCSVNWNGCARRLVARVTITWLSHDWVVSWSVVKAWSLEYLLNDDEIVVSQQFAGIKKTFNGLVVKPESTLVIVEVESTDIVESTDVVESGQTLNLLELWEVRPMRRWTYWRRKRFVWCQEEPVRDVRDRWRHGSVTGGSRRPWPRPSPSFHPVNLGRVDSRFVREFIYRIACWRARRSTSLKNIMEAYICFYYSFIL